jgi:hypothetical protein
VSEVQLAQYGSLGFETRLVEQSYATPQAVVKYNKKWCANGVAVVRAFKEELGESKLAFHSQRVPPRESRRQEGIKSDSRVDFNVESGRIALAVNTPRHHASPSTTDSG